MGGTFAEKLLSFTFLPFRQYRATAAFGKTLFRKTHARNSHSSAERVATSYQLALLCILLLYHLAAWRGVAAPGMQRCTGAAQDCCATLCSTAILPCLQVHGGKTTTDI